MSKRKHTTGVVLALVMVLLVACAPKAAPTPVSQAPAPPATILTPAVSAPAKQTAPTAPAKSAWEDKWEKTVQAAKVEGELMLYLAGIGEGRQNLVDAFRSKYGVRVESVVGSSNLLVPKISAERRAGIYSGDALVDGSTGYIPFKGLLDNLEPALILPELADPDVIKKTWYFGELPWGDNAHTMLIGLMDLRQPIAFNTNLVKRGELKSHQDLLDPKWKGKVSIYDPRLGGGGIFWFAVSLELGDLDVNYMRQLVTKQDVVFTRDWRLQMEWLALGKQAITIGPNESTVTSFIKLGAPVERTNLGSPWISGASSGIAMFSRQPHPNAAQLFINWLLSQEGALLHSKVVGSQSQRLDVPTTYVDPSKVIKPGLNIFRADQEEFATKKDTYYAKLAKEVFGPE